LFFRAESWKDAKHLLQLVFIQNNTQAGTLLPLLKTSNNFTEPGRMLLFIFPLFVFMEILLGKKEFSSLFSKSPKPLRWSFYYLLIIFILFFGVLNSAPQFIYFQF
jgi:hypothetical protein